MSGWDTAAIVSANLGLRPEEPAAQSQVAADISFVEAQAQFRQFLRTFKSQDSTSFPYREELKNNYNEGIYNLTVDLNDVRAFNEKLLHLLIQRPAEYLSVFEAAAKEVAVAITSSDIKSEEELKKFADVQILLKNFPRITQIRALASDHVSTLVTVRGIVVAASRPRIKATRLSIMCRNCKVTKVIPCGAGFGGARLPRECDTRPGANAVEYQKCPLDPYVILADNTSYIDQQRLKLQESPESVPTGELPRHISLALDGYLVGSVKPGTRVRVVGMYTTYEAQGSDRRQQGVGSDVGIRIPYIRVFGIEQENEASDLMLGKFAAEDEEEMHSISKQDKLYEKISQAMCPAIFDSEDTKNIKSALAVQLFGGARKSLPDGMRLRGDINVLLLGDPSVAKSQFLKFASQVAPIGVYTSGKGSSAAGLTASVIRDPGTGEFHLEGGALVLADGGLVCIDEFDKMREQDRVAIHEAMEQQTISIAKAGITTILNSRTSVLAAANPVFGRYDDMRSPTENIDFQTTILSRFDLIFIVRDIQDARRDADLARHVINVHRYKDAAVKQLSQQNGVGIMDIATLRKYVAFARAKCDPRLSEEAANLLKDTYVKFRSEVKGVGATSIPMTVRQLEAIVRIAEARARMELSPVATTEHIQEAIRLFQVSTYRAATTNMGDMGLGLNIVEFDRKVKNAEAELTTRVSIGQTTSTAAIAKWMEERYERPVVLKALDHLTSRGSFRFKKTKEIIRKSPIRCES